MLIIYLLGMKSYMFEYQKISGILWCMDRISVKLLLESNPKKKFILKKKKKTEKPEVVTVVLFGVIRLWVISDVHFPSLYFFEHCFTSLFLPQAC